MSEDNSQATEVNKEVSRIEYQLRLGNHLGGVTIHIFSNMANLREKLADVFMDVRPGIKYGFEIIMVIRHCHDNEFEEIGTPKVELAT